MHEKEEETLLIVPQQMSHYAVWSTINSHKTDERLFTRRVCCARKLGQEMNISAPR